MKKHGFTLAEVLITLGIIAIGAATIAPLYMESKPDKYKIKVLRCYNTLSEASDRLLSNPYIYSKERLDSFGAPAPISGFSTSYTGDCKFPLLVKDLLKLETVTNCADGSYTGRTKDGTEWGFTKKDDIYEYDVTITFPQRSGTSCGPYNASSCRNPNVYMFTVDNIGEVSPHEDDALTKAYIRNMTNIHRKDDLSALGN